MSKEFQWKTVRAASYGGGVDVHGFKPYESGSLRGQTGKFFIDSYESVEAAVAAHPDLMRDGEVRYGNKWTDPKVSLNHLPDENTPVAGGMYPDDYDDDN